MGLKICNSFTHRPKNYLDPACLLLHKKVFRLQLGQRALLIMEELNNLNNRPDHILGLLLRKNMMFQHTAQGEALNMFIDHVHILVVLEREQQTRQEQRGNIILLVSLQPQLQLLQGGEDAVVVVHALTL